MPTGEGVTIVAIRARSRGFACCGCQMIAGHWCRLHQDQRDQERYQSLGLFRWTGHYWREKSRRIDWKHPYGR